MIRKLAIVLLLVAGCLTAREVPEGTLVVKEISDYPEGKDMVISKRCVR